MSALADPIADFLTRLRNAGAARKEEFSVPFSKMKREIARILKAEGYIEDFSIQTDGPRLSLKIRLKYVNKVPAFAGVRRISKPGLRQYVGARDIPRVLGGLGIAILSTPKGILTGHEARRRNVGGELLAYVW
ncbi:MAG: 30S ribosomal protein S8 [Chthoniobacterales bacterium]|nr:30S ribosomal protein S8 [Chthoniobacterales bacterium]